jgi:hypothetical protein
MVTEALSKTANDGKACFAAAARRMIEAEMIEAENGTAGPVNYKSPGLATPRLIERPVRDGNDANARREIFGPSHHAGAKLGGICGNVQ